jgi:phosphoribosylanthranilate isomerase
MKEPENIKQVLQLGPDRIGLIFYPHSSRCVLPDLKPEQLDFLPDTLHKTGVFVNQPLAEIKRISEQFMLDSIQLHGNETPEFCQELYGVRPIIKAFGVNDETDWNSIKHYEKMCSLYLFDTASKTYGGSGKRFNLTTLKRYNGKLPYFIAGGIGPQNIKTVMNEIRELNDKRLIGLEVNSAAESSIGIKDIDLLTSFIKQFKDENQLS